MRNKEAIDDGQEQRNDKLKDVEEEDRRMKADRDERIHGTIGHEEPPSELRSDESLRWNISAQKDINEAKKYHVTINNHEGKDLGEICADKSTVSITFQSTTNKDKSLSEHGSQTSAAVAVRNGRYALPVERLQQRSYSK